MKKTKVSLSKLQLSKETVLNNLQAIYGGDSDGDKPLAPSAARNCSLKCVSNWNGGIYGGCNPDNTTNTRVNETIPGMATCGLIH